MAQKVHGITIDLDVNTSAVNEAFKDINKSLNATQKELTQVDKLLKIDPKNTTLLAQKQYLLSSAIEDTKSKLVQLAKAKEKADKDSNVDKTSKQYRDLERDIIKTKDSLEKLTHQANQNEDALKGIETSASGIGKQLGNATNNALQFGDILKANVVSDFIVGGVKSLANGFVNIGKALANNVKENVDYVGELKAMAQQYNLTTQELQLYIKASDIIDTDIATITKSMAKLTKSMTSTGSGVVNAFKKLKVEVKDSSGNLRDSNEVFNEVIEALGKVENETLQDSYAMEIFGKSASDLGSLIDGGAQKIANLNEYLKENNLLLSDEEIDSIDTIGDSLDYMNLALDGLKEKLISQLAPVITPLIDEITKFIVEHKDSIIELVKELIDKFTSGDGQKMFDNFNQLVEDVGQFIDDTPRMVEALETLALPIKAIADVVGAIVSGLKWIIGTNTKDIEFQLDNIKNGGVSMSGLMHSQGFGALKSGGFASGGITLNATFNNNGSLDEASAIKYANIMTQIINDNLGGMI